MVASTAQRSKCPREMIKLYVVNRGCNFLWSTCTAI